MGEEQTIDLQKMTQIAVANKKKILGIIVTCVLIALILALILPNKYTSSTLIRGKSPKGNLPMEAAAMALLVGAPTAGPNLQSYQELFKSRSVLDPVIANLDLPEVEKEKLTNEIFAKKVLEITNPKNSDLIEIKATWKSPEGAQSIARSILLSFKQTLTKINQTDQSLHMKFLNERLAIAKKEMEEAEVTLDRFRRDTRVYAPDAQAKYAIDAISQLDQQLINLDIQNKTNNIRLQTVNAQLEKQNIALRQYNLADSEPIQQIRNRLLDKQMVLLDKTQRYTDKHPEVILIRKEVEELENQLKKEVEQSILAETSTLNPIHASLLQSKSNIEATIMTSESMEEVLRSKLANIEDRLNTLSTETRNYIALERRVNIAQDMYSILTRNYEQTRIQESMESMDIQIVDEANLPKGPSWPNKLLFVAIGGVMGVMLTCCYLMILYRKQYAVQ